MGFGVGGIDLEDGVEATGLPVHNGADAVYRKLFA
jgi:hypothetical protein